ncbi:MAG: hypothetical protein JKY65_24795 [Planctomycetes bacterium]|nr:hypothetical protein [Planctomycetota bacterium]
MTAKEKTYARALERLVQLKAKRVEGLASKSGASGVRLRFGKLTVVRLHFPSRRAAKAYAARPSLSRRGPSGQRVEVRGAELVLVGGEGMKASGADLLTAAWAASLDPPSVTTKSSAKVLRRADGKRLNLRPLQSRPQRKPLSSSLLAGTYLTHGAGRVVIDRVQPGPDGARCRVRFLGIQGESNHEFQAVFSGAALVLRVDPKAKPEPEWASGKREERVRKGAGREGKSRPRELCYVWQPSPEGALAFVRSGSDDLLPRGSDRFWRDKAE